MTVVRRYPIELEPFADAVRERFGRVTPYRLGFEVARQGAVLPASPYGPRSHANRCYVEGYSWGKAWVKLERERAERPMRG